MYDARKIIVLLVRSSGNSNTQNHCEAAKLIFFLKFIKIVCKMIIIANLTSLLNIS